MTFKQLEALYWIAQLGGFAQAAARLHASQSAISKRIHELEQHFAIELFDRNQRSARLTEKGEELFLLSKKLLEHRDAAVEQFSGPEVTQRRLRIGTNPKTIEHFGEMPREGHARRNLTQAAISRLRSRR